MADISARILEQGERALMQTIATFATLACGERVIDFEPLAAATDPTERSGGVAHDE